MHGTMYKRTAGDNSLNASGARSNSRSFKYNRMAIQRMRHVYWGVLILLVIGVACAGCTSQKPVSPAVTTVSTPVPVMTTQITPSLPAVPENLAGDWVLTTMAVGGGTSILVPNARITMTFNNEGTISGNGGCNNYFGSFTLTGDTSQKGEGLIIGPIGSTKKYCQGSSEQETTYLQVLQDTTSYVVDTRQLTLTGKTQNVLIFQRPSTVTAPGEGELPT